MVTIQPRLRPLDLERIERYNHPDINYEKQYLCKINGKFVSGFFIEKKQTWADGTYLKGVPWDATGHRLDSDSVYGWEGIWEIVENGEDCRYRYKQQDRYSAGWWPGDDDGFDPYAD